MGRGRAEAATSPVARPLGGLAARCVQDLLGGGGPKGLAEKKRKRSWRGLRAEWGSGARGGAPGVAQGRGWTGQRSVREAVPSLT